MGSSVPQSSWSIVLSQVWKLDEHVLSKLKPHVCEVFCLGGLPRQRSCRGAGGGVPRKMQEATIWGANPFHLQWNGMQCILVVVAHQASFRVPSEGAAEEILAPAQRVEHHGGVASEFFFQRRDPHEGHHALPARRERANNHIVTFDHVLCSY